MEELLGLRTEIVFLVYKAKKNDDYHVISWEEAFDKFDMTMMPPFAMNMVKKISDQSH